MSSCPRWRIGFVTSIALPKKEILTLSFTPGFRKPGVNQTRRGKSFLFKGPSAGTNFEAPRMAVTAHIVILVRGIILATARNTPDSDSLKNKRHPRMKSRVTNHDRDGSTTHCLMCNARIARSPGRTLDLICLICRAAILDRVFQARRRRLQPIERSS